MRRENKGRTELREKKENEKQTVQDREISETQWCIVGKKAEMEVKEGVFQRHTEHQPWSCWVSISQPLHSQALYHSLAQAWAGVSLMAALRTLLCLLSQKQSCSTPLGQAESH